MEWLGDGNSPISRVCCGRKAMRRSLHPIARTFNFCTLPLPPTEFCRESVECGLCCVEIQIQRALSLDLLVEAKPPNAWEAAPISSTPLRAAIGLAHLETARESWRQIGSQTGGRRQGKPQLHDSLGHAPRSQDVGNAYWDERHGRGTGAGWPRKLAMDESAS